MKTTVTDISEVPEALREHYEERDGKHVLRLEGDAPTGYATAADLAEAEGKVVTFRNTYTGLLKEIAGLAGVDEAKDLGPLKAHLAKYKDIDPEKHAALVTQVAELEAKGVKKPSDVNTLLKEQLATALEPMNTKIDTLTEDLTSEREARVAAEGKVRTQKLEKEVWGVLAKANAEPEAMEFLLNKASKFFEVVDEKVVARQGYLSKVTAGADLTVKEWVASAASDYDFAFRKSKGTEADPKPGEIDPNVKQLVNPTAEELGSPANVKAYKEGKLKIVSK